MAMGDCCDLVVGLHHLLYKLAQKAGPRPEQGEISWHRLACYVMYACREINLIFGFILVDLRF